MSPLPERALTSRVGQGYAADRALHGNLGLSLCRYSERIDEVLEKCLGSNPSEDQAVSFFEQLHTSDLYLTTACALPSEAAWARFDHLYDRYVQRLTASVCATKDAAEDLAEGLPGYIFLPDQTGRSRIAGFGGEVR